jgi:Rrf2 family protein
MCNPVSRNAANPFIGVHFPRERAAEYLTNAVGKHINQTEIRPVQASHWARGFTRVAYHRTGPDFHDFAKTREESRFVMQLSTKGRYAVMAIIEVARPENTGPISLSEIAARLDLSIDYLEQLFMKLRRRGLVRSVRGPGGGYVMGRDAAAISIGEIMAAVNEPFKMTRCAGEIESGCVIGKRCSTHYLWDALGAHIETFLGATTLEDVLSGPYAAPQAGFRIANLAMG